MCFFDVAEIAFVIKNEKEGGKRWMQIQIAVPFSDKAKCFGENPLEQMGMRSKRRGESETRDLPSLARTRPSRHYRRRSP